MVGAIHESTGNFARPLETVGRQTHADHEKDIASRLIMEIACHQGLTEQSGLLHSLHDPQGSLGNFTGKRFDAKKAWSRSNSRVSGREAIWDSWKDAGSSSSISKPRSTATQKTKAGTGFVSPLPEGFPPGE